MVIPQVKGLGNPSSKLTGKFGESKQIDCENGQNYIHYPKHTVTLGPGIALGIIT